MVDTLPDNARKDHREPSIFISHSSRDIIVARAVRNLLEDRNHNFVELIGLASFLKAAEPEIKHLLEREIAARDWLLLVNSDNARQSPYVQFELQVARSLCKPFYSIDCDRFITAGNRYAIEKSLLPCVRTFSQGIRIFISYTRSDAKFAQQLSHQLQERNFEVWTDALLTPGTTTWAEEMSQAIETTLATGVMIVLLSKSSLRSKYVLAEIETAQQRRGMILPILLEQAEIPIRLKHLKYLDVSHFASRAEQLDQSYKALEEMRHRRFTEVCGGTILNA